MSASFNNVQKERIAAYRRVHRSSPDSQSDSQLPPPQEQLTGRERDLTTSGGGAWSNAAAPPPKRGQSGVAGLTSTPPPSQPAATATRGGGTGVNPVDRPKDSANDVTEYIFRLERQNDQLRQQLTAMAQTPGFDNSSLPSKLDHGEEGKREFLNSVLTQVESIISAHKAKAHAEVQKYKNEAEAAQLALKNLRLAIQQEGMDLSMAPAMIAFQRKQQLLQPNGSSVPSLGLQIPPEAQKLLETLSAELLNQLLSLKATDDVPAVVGQAVKGCFEGIVVHFTDQIYANTRFMDDANEVLRRELAEAREETRKVELAQESKRIELVTKHDADLQALRDELACFNKAADDDVAGNIQRRAFDEYAQLLSDSRRQLQQMRLELENERNHSAQVCLKLKAALQKRNDEFEKAVLAKAEDVVQQRERRIAELEARIAASAPPERRECGIQVGESLVSVPPRDQFVQQLMLSVKKDPRSTAQHNEMFEREVWKRTQALLAKYGDGTQSPVAPPPPVMPTPQTGYPTAQPAYRSESQPLQPPPHAAPQGHYYPSGQPLLTGHSGQGGPGEVVRPRYQAPSAAMYGFNN